MMIPKAAIRQTHFVCGIYDNMAAMQMLIMGTLLHESERGPETRKLWPRNLRDTFRHPHQVPVMRKTFQCHDDITEALELTLIGHRHKAFRLQCTAFPFIHYPYGAISQGIKPLWQILAHTSQRRQAMLGIIIEYAALRSRDGMTQGLVSLLWPDAVVRLLANGSAVFVWIGTSEASDSFCSNTGRSPWAILRYIDLGH